MSEYIINTEQIEEINKSHGGMKTVTSWLSCYAIWDTSFTPPLMKSEHIAVTLPGIVRCRDCKYGHEVDWQISEIPSNYLDCTGPLVEPWDYYHDEPKDNPVRPDGFCAWGERKWLTCKCGEEMESEGVCPSCGRYVMEEE